MNIIDASLCAANAMDSFSKNLEDKTEFNFYIRFFFCINFSIVFHCCIITAISIHAFYSYFIVFFYMYQKIDIYSQRSISIFPILLNIFKSAFPLWNLFSDMHKTWRDAFMYFDRASLWTYFSCFEMLPIWHNLPKEVI